MASEKTKNNQEITSSEYSFYAHYENIKNSLYRQLSNARTSKLFLPKFYYNWFYSKERQHYNNLILRQKLGPIISDTEISEYNKLRKEFVQKSSFIIVKKQEKTDDNTVYDNIYLKREKISIMPFVLGIGCTSYFYLKLSRYWFLYALIPVCLIKYSDYKFQSIEELESFYNYVSERREANRLYSDNKYKIDGFKSLNINNFSLIKKELENSNKSLEEAYYDLQVAYLKNAISNNNL